MAQQKCKICGSSISEFIENIFDDRHGYPGRFDIYRCTVCGFGQTVPEIPEDKIPEVYTKYYPRKNAINVEELKQGHLRVMSPLSRWWMGVNNTAHYHIRKGTKVLDIGCGDCTSIREINAMGADGYGIEPDENIRVIVDVLGLNVHVGLFKEIPYPEKYFDFITMSQVLEHMHHPVELLTSLGHILKDDGQIIIGVPSIDSRLRKKYGYRWLNWHVPYHLNHFSQRSLELLAERCGYEIRKIRTYTPNLWVDLQVRLAKYDVQEGVKVPFFNAEFEPCYEKTGNNIQEKRNRFGSRYFNKAMSLFRRYNPIQTLFLRMIDALSKGESYLVVFEKRK